MSRKDETPEGLTAQVVTLFPEFARRRGAILAAFQQAKKEDIADPWPPTTDPGRATCRVHLLWVDLTWNTDPQDAPYWGTRAVRVARHISKTPTVNRVGQSVYRWMVRSWKDGVSWLCWHGEAASRPAARRQAQAATRDIKQTSRSSETGFRRERTDAP
jgi:hypothetical protein